MEYIPQRVKVNRYLKRYLENPEFVVEEDFFIASMCIDLSASPKLVKEILLLYLDKEMIYRDGSLLKNISQKGKTIKTVSELEVNDIMDDILKSKPPKDEI